MGGVTDFSKYRHRITKVNHHNSLAYRRMLKKHKYIPLSLSMLKDAGRFVNQTFNVGEVVIYQEIRPVKIIAGFSPTFVIVQFLDRPDTPIARVDSRHLYSGVPFELPLSQHEISMKESFGDFLEEAEQAPTNAFEDGWW